MPLFYQQNINGDSKLGIWSIEENEHFFLEKVPLQHEVSHPHKRLQHLAGRYLLQYLFPGFPYELIEIADTRKPFLTNEAFHFSISHCGKYAAALISKTYRVGIDIEVVRPLIEKVKHKFLSKKEMQMLFYDVSRLPTPDSSLQTPNSRLLTPDSRLLTISWSAKEAMFKWFGEGSVDFREHMQIDSIDGNLQGGFLHCTFSKKNATRLLIEYQVFEGLVLAWVISSTLES